MRAALAVCRQASHRGRRARLAGPIVAAAVAAIACAPAFAQDGARPPRASVSDTPAPGVVRVAQQPQQYDGYPVSLIFFDLYGGTGSADSDRDLRRRIERLASPIGVGRFSVLLADRALAEIRSLPGVRDASYAIYLSERPGEVVLVVTATLVADEKPQPRGALRTGRLEDLPVLLEDSDSLLRFTFNGGAGVYADRNPWFASPATYTGRSPIAQDPPGAGWTSWGEAWVEYGIAGATRLGNTPAYAFGEFTALTSGATGQDLFRSDTRTKTLPEKAYAGLLWARPGVPRSARVSIGRQNWQLDNGFLFSKFSGGANAGPNPALYLNPRTTYEMTVLGEVKVGRLRAEYFDVDPAELKDFDSGTRFQGVHLSWLDREAWDLGATAYRVPESNSVLRSPQGGVVPRDGQRTSNLRAGHRGVAGVPGLAALAEYAQQTHPDADVRARAGYAQLGYTARERPWRPSLTYRYARFSGDDPNTARYEAFDAPLSSGLDEWVQGINFKKVVTNSNVDSHRIRFNVAPNNRVNYTVDWFRLLANVPLPTGERAYGDEVDFAVRWAISKRLFFLGVAGVAWPDDVLKAQTQGAAKPWVTVQASLFWGF
jgi:hypothetical protein